MNIASYMLNLENELDLGDSAKKIESCSQLESDSQFDDLVGQPMIFD